MLFSGLRAPLYAPAVALVAAVFFSACASGQMTTRDGSILTGTVIGAGSGAIIGEQTGDAAEGALIGGVLGGIAGGLYGDKQQQAENQQATNQAVLQRQAEQIAANRALIEQLKARNVNADLTDRGVVVTLPDVFFRFGSAELTSEAASTTRDIASILRSDAPNRTVAVEGHTDSVGPADFNQGLSERRAASVAAGLRAGGVKGSLIRVVGYGETRPKLPNTTSDGRDDPQARARNRRVEVVVLNPA